MDKLQFVVVIFAVSLSKLCKVSLCNYKVYLSSFSIRYTGWPEKNVPNFRMALCNRVGEMNQQKSMYVMSVLV